MGTGRLGAAAAAAIICGALAGAAPAGATIAYEKGAGTVHTSVWVAADDGSGAVRIANGDEPTIAPDGSAVLMLQSTSSGAPRLALVPAAGGDARELAGDALLGVWSPDSRTIAAIVSGSTDRQQLVLIDVASGATRPIATGLFGGVSFAPDSSAIAYSRAPSDRGIIPRDDIYTVPVAGGTPVRLTSDHRSSAPVWGPTSIAFARYRKGKSKNDNPKSDVYLMAPDGSGQRRLTRTHAPFLLTGPSPLAWSDDGTRLLGEFGGQDTLYGLGINPSTGRIHTFSRVKNLEYGFVPAGVSHDGHTVLGATGGFDPGSHHDVVTLPWGGGKPRVLVRNAFSPSWTR